MMAKTTHSKACLLLGLLVSVAALAMDKLPDITEADLQELTDTDLTLVYTQPGTDLSAYKSIWLVDATVAFKKNWKRDQNRSYKFKIRSSDMERIKSDVAGLLKEVFTEKLTEGGYTLAEEAGDGVLIVRPTIVNLDIVAPATSSPTRIYQYARSAGEMVLYVELYDSRTGDILAKAMDRKKDRELTFFQLRSRVINRSATKRMLRSWAGTLREELDEARGAPGSG